MGLGLSLYTLYQLARVTVPTFVDGVTGRVAPDTIDERARAFARRVLSRARVSLDVEGVARVPAERAFVYMSNHQSHLDIPIIYATCPARSLRMVAKTELYRIPVWGRALRAAGFIEIDRRDRARAIASLEVAAARIAGGVSVWIAPEGSRSRTGEVGPLKKGGFHLARQTRTSIVPIAISGTFQILPPGASAMSHDVRVRVVYGAPIEVEGRDLGDLMAEVGAFLTANAAASAD
jgi:1-acyl-sn-glycerol-3-phosphate acyltransferase